MPTNPGASQSGSTKQLVSVRYSREVLAYFKSTGEGWQSPMDRVYAITSRAIPVERKDNAELFHRATDQD